MSSIKKPVKFRDKFHTLPVKVSALLPVPMIVSPRGWGRIPSTTNGTADYYPLTYLIPRRVPVHVLTSIEGGRIPSPSIPLISTNTIIAVVMAMITIVAIIIVITTIMIRFCHSGEG
jgi:hypothetical protein